jgi:hypothetical protein
MTLHAKYDAAQTTRENLRHWAMADGLSADAAASTGACRRLHRPSAVCPADPTYTFAGIHRLEKIPGGLKSVGTSKNTCFEARIFNF